MSISRRGGACCSRTNWSVIACFAAALSFSPGTVRADDIPTSFNTPAGLVEVKPGAGPACGGTSYDEQCLVLYIGGKRVAGDYHLSLSAVLPSVGNPALLGVETSTGGNGCCWESYLVDVSTAQLYAFSGYSLNQKARLVGHDVFFESIVDQNKLGDLLLITYRYRIGSGIKPSSVESHPQYNNKPLANGMYPYDILSNPHLREPLMRLIGEDKFAEYREYLGVSGPIKIINNQYFVGSGCKPHDCGSRFGIFVIDMKNDLAWALVGEGKYNQPSTARRWGILTSDDVVPKKEILLWQRDQRIAFGAIKDVPLSENMISLYLKPRLSQTTSGSSSLEMKPFQTPPISGHNIPMETDGGTFAVPVTINNTITLNFIVDSGAADVSVPADVVMTLIRTGTIASTDFLGEKTYQLADGSTVPSKTFRIQSLKVGDRTLNGVVGSVAPVQGSPLLGQSFLNRFKSWSIDNEKHALVLE